MLTATSAPTQMKLTRWTLFCSFRPAKNRFPALLSRKTTASTPFRGRSTPAPARTSSSQPARMTSACTSTKTLMLSCSPPPPPSTAWAWSPSSRAFTVSAPPSSKGASFARSRAGWPSRASFPTPPWPMRPRARASTTCSSPTMAFSTKHGPRWSVRCTRSCARVCPVTSLTPTAKLEIRGVASRKTFLNIFESGGRPRRLCPT
mmetsp:Transcript_23788/g.75853  ORF Transcript_23788/g.75853 Transcript_23788/m.75853 type:complete len:204 (+) Transcript_23788:926-1537(+)